MKELVEEWRDIKGYEGMYQVSNLGDVRSLDRVVKYKNGKLTHYIGKILKGCVNTEGYLYINLAKNGINKATNIHKIVWNVFGDGRSIKFPDRVVDHHDTNKLNNKINNLRLITQRENLLNNKRNKKYPGVRKNNNYFYSSILINYKSYNLGTFKIEEEAGEVYQIAKEHAEKGDFLEWYAEYMNIYKNKNKNKFKYIYIKIRLNKTQYYLGAVKTKEEAGEVYQIAKEHAEKGDFLEWYTEHRNKHIRK